MLEFVHDGHIFAKFTWLPKLANMQIRHILLADLPLEVELRSRIAKVRLKSPHPESWTFRLRQVRSLTVNRINSEILDEAEESRSRPLLVHFDQASPQARRLLRDHRISFVGEGGECFLYSPPLIVDRELPSASRSSAKGGAAFSTEARNPFGRSASRVLRWLLLHPEDEFSLNELARKTMLSRALVSRVTRALHEESWIDLEPDPVDRRTRLARVRRPREALSAWLEAWNRRRIAVESWDIGTRDAEATLKRLRAVKSRHPDFRWAIGGLAGASLTKRVVEPGRVLIWVPKHQVDTLEEALLPRHSSPVESQLRVATAPDDFILDLAVERAGLTVADPVQLWLDCSGEGERALEAADAIAGEMGW